MNATPEYVATARVDYGVVLLASGPEGVTPSPQELEDSNGLLAVTRGGAALIAGIDSGTVDISFVPVAEEPSNDLGGWDEMVDVSIDARSGDLRVLSVLGEQISLPSLSHAGPGVYRVRCMAAGRNEHSGEIEVESSERFRLITWLAEASPATEHQVLPNRYRR